MLTLVNLIYAEKKSTMKRRKKALLIGLSIFGGTFISAAFAAAFICTAPASMTQDDYEAFEDFAFINSDDHVSSYKTTFNDKKATSEYETKYEDTIKEAGEKLASYSATKAVKDVSNTYTLRNQSDNLAVIYVEDFMDNLGKEIDNFFKQIKSDREKVNADYKINYSTLKKAYNNNVSKLHDTILDCERYIAELDKEAEDYQYRVESYQYQIEITRVEIENEHVKYETDVAYLNETYESDLSALDAAEEQVTVLKESYEAQIKSEEPVTVEEIVEEVNETVFEEVVAPVTSIYREPSSVSLAEKEEEPEEIKTEAVVETVSEFNADLFSFKCFDHCYLYLEPKDKESYWHF